MTKNQNVLVICDRGAMDPSAYMDVDAWQSILDVNQLDAVDIRDNRYNQIVHMVSAADGAPNYYTVANNKTRREGLTQAIEQDKKTREVGVCV